MRKTYSIDGLDPVKLYGVGDSILREFCSYYPNLKVVARGNEIILDGKAEDIEDFLQKFNILTEKAKARAQISN